MITMNEKINYQLVLENYIDKIKQLERKPTLLLHACCAPCSTYVLEYLEKYFDITIYYYNPNIYPHDEYSRRLNELVSFLKKSNAKIKLVTQEYNPDEYFHAILGFEDKGEKSIRCYHCYKLRMKETAKYAQHHKFDYFTTTLSISPYKNSDWINEIGTDLEKEYNVKYLYADFKKKNGYKRSLELSRQYNLYRQNYCGCQFTYENWRNNTNICQRQ